MASPTKQTQLPEPQPLSMHDAVPCALMTAILQHLPQRQRLKAALVCRRWAALVRSQPSLCRHTELGLSLNSPTCVERTEGFLAWLVPRAASVQQLTVITRRSGSGDAAGEALVWNNVVAALALAGPNLLHLTLEWSGELVITAWAATLTALQSASFKANRVIVRPGLHNLASLTDLRLKSTSTALAFVPGTQQHGAAAPSPAALLPPGLRKARVEGCLLTSLPPAIVALRQLEDLVLSDNHLRNADLEALSQLTTLKQLTLMGCRMRRLPLALSALTNLRVLYVDMGLELPTEGEALPTHMQCSEVLGPLSSLAIVSLGACHLEEFPAALVKFTTLRALYLDDNSVQSLPDGPYLQWLRVLGCDWRVLFRSHGVLASAPKLRKLCLMAPGKGLDAVPHGPEAVAAVVRSVRGYPGLRTVLLPMVDGQRSVLSVATFNVVVGLSQARNLDVRAVTYQEINNEWLEFLEQEDSEA